MNQCVFTNSAKQDLNDITDYTLKAWGKPQTIKYMQELKSKSLMLASHPSIGTKCHHALNNLLSFPAGKHIFYYLKNKEEITIVRIWHKHICPSIHSFHTQ